MLKDYLIGFLVFFLFFRQVYRMIDAIIDVILKGKPQVFAYLYILELFASYYILKHL